MNDMYFAFQAQFKRLTALEKRLAAAEVDARRWRYVRMHSDIVGEDQEGVYRWQFSAPDIDPDSIDADVDAAIEAAAAGSWE